MRNPSTVSATIGCLFGSRFDPCDTSEAQRLELNDQILNAERLTLKVTSKATGYLTRAEMYGARTLNGAFSRWWLLFGGDTP